MATAGNQRVMVAVRVRPTLTEGAQMQQQEKFELQAVHRTGDNSLKVELTRPREPTKSSSFTFDYIFDQESTQLEVYEDAVVDMIDSALAGHNATLLAYGQTGSGKTFTVLGDVKPNPLENDLLTNNSGMFLRVLSDLLEYKQRQAKKGWHVVVGLSCMEIYNENIRDLFGGKANQPPPPIKAVMIGDTVLLPSLITKEMTSLQAVFGEIQLAIARRKSRATDTNAASSRSHCLFTIDILQQAASAPAPTLDLIDQTRRGSDDKGAVRRVAAPASPSATKGDKPASTTAQDPATLQPYEMPFQGNVYHRPGQKEPIYASKIILADLAGSERILRSHVTGEGLTEATSINSSLTALGNVVHSLYEGSYASYRTSSLTSLLKPTFSHPSSRVLLLAQCSPTQLTFDETISTLHFANKVKAMKVTTTTGAELEKLQFDYLEAEKQYDSIVCDLHIFAVETLATLPLIRRVLPQHGGLYYDAAATQAAERLKNGMRERRAHLDAMGALAVAQKERDALLARVQREESEQVQKDKQLFTDMRADLVQEHMNSMNELQESLSEEMYAAVRHSMQRVLLEAAAMGNRLLAEEEAKWAELMSLFAQEHRKACGAELKRNTATLASLVQELNKQQESMRMQATPEEVEEQRQYALATWSHCLGKRFFASCIELREQQMALLRYWSGNARLERWERDNQYRLQ